ncbi:MAG TPA: DUF378 domain-containing protein [Candidatus Paceibacterota bacterium]
MKSKGLHTITYILLIIGGLNWGLEFLGWGIGSFLPSGLASLIYLLVGLSALYELFTHKNSCKHCEVKPMQSM